MKFQNPAFLYALPLALIPLLIHLFASKLQKRTPFPWVKLLLNVKREGQRRRHLLEIIILLMRTLAILSLIFLAARPYSGKIFEYDNLVIDWSPTSRVNTPRKLIAKIQKIHPEINVFYLLDHLYRNSLPYDLPADFMKIRDIRGKTIVVSDFQNSNVKNFRDSVVLAVKIPPPEDNLRILDVRVEPGITMKGFEANLKIFLRAERRTAVRVNLYRKEKIVTGGNFEVSPDSVNELTLRFVPPGGGIWKAEVLPYDQLPQNNQKYFNLTVLEALKIGLVGRNRFLKKALNPFKIENYPLEVQEIKSPEELENFKIVILVNPDIPVDFFLKIMRFVEKGGNLLIFSSTIPLAFLNVLSIKAERLDSVKVAIVGDTIFFKKALYLEGGVPILTDITGKTVAIKKKYAKGNIILVGLSPDVDDGFFPVSPAFVPFVYSLLESFFSSKLKGLVLDAGTPCRLEPEIRVIEPEGKKFRCAEEYFKRMGLYLADSVEIGVNMPDAESELRFLQDGELKERFGSVLDTQGFEKIVSGSKVFDRYFVYFLVFYVIFESLVLGLRFKL